MNVKESNHSNQIGASLIASTIILGFIIPLFILSPSAIKTSYNITLCCIGIELTTLYIAQKSGNLLTALISISAFFYTSLYIPSYASITIISITAALCAWNMAKATKKPAKERIINVAMCSFVLSGVAMSTIQGISYSQDMAARILQGSLSMDDYFHASIAASFKNYLIPSTGVQEITFTPYHFLSHLIIASISKISGEGILETYGVSHIAMFIPALISSGAYFMDSLMPKQANWGHGLNSQRNYLAILALGCVFLLAVSLSTYTQIPISVDFITSSSVISLIMLYGVLIFLSKPDSSIVDNIILNTGIALTTFAKGPTGLMLALGSIAVIGTSKQRPKKQKLLQCMAIAFTFLLSAKIISSGNLNPSVIPGIQFMPFIRGYSLWGNHLSDALGALLNKNQASSIQTIKAIGSILVFHVVSFGITWIALWISLKKKWVFATEDQRKIVSKFLIFNASIAFLVIGFISMYSQASFFGMPMLYISVPIASIYICHQVMHLSKTISTFIIICMLSLISTGWGNGLDQLLATENWRRQHYNSDQSIAIINELKSTRKVNQKKIKYVHNANDLSFNLKDVSHLVVGDDCRSIPLVISGISEKAWTGLMDIESCHYGGAYGYGSLNTTKE